VQTVGVRMVATCWVEKPEGADHVHHISRDKTENHDYNLEWVTPQEHMVLAMAYCPLREG
jgi:hypothetical protein